MMVGAAVVCWEEDRSRVPSPGELGTHAGAPHLLEENRLPVAFRIFVRIL